VVPNTGLVVRKLAQRGCPRTQPGPKKRTRMRNTVIQELPKTGPRTVGVDDAVLLGKP